MFFFVFITFLHGFALLPFLLLVFRFSSWFVPLFGYPIYGRRVGGGRLLFLRKGGDSRTVANMRPNFFSHISIEQESLMKVFFFSHTLLEQRKVHEGFLCFAYLARAEKGFMKVFFVSLSGCMVSIVICFSVIVLKDRRLSDFWVVREAFFFGG